MDVMMWWDDMGFVYRAAHGEVEADVLVYPCVAVTIPFETFVRQILGIPCEEGRESGADSTRSSESTRESE